MKPASHNTKYVQLRWREGKIYRYVNIYGIFQELFIPPEFMWAIKIYFNLNKYLKPAYIQKYTKYIILYIIIYMSRAQQQQHWKFSKTSQLHCLFNTFSDKHSLSIKCSVQYKKKNEIERLAGEEWKWKTERKKKFHYSHGQHTFLYYMRTLNGIIFLSLCSFSFLEIIVNEWFRVM